MVIGLVKEIKNHEYRVGMTPSCVKAYISAGHKVLVEKNAGIGSGYSDQEYSDAGAQILDSDRSV